MKRKDTEISVPLKDLLAFDSLLSDGFSITIRNIKGGRFAAECHNYDDDPGVPHSVYGKGDTWIDAVKDAAQKWAIRE